MKPGDEAYQALCGTLREEAKEQVERIGAALLEIERGADVRRTRALLEEAFRQAKTFLDAYYQKDFSRQGVEIWNSCGPVEHCVEQVREFIDAGADHVTIRPIGDDLDGQFEIFLREVLFSLRQL